MRYSQKSCDGSGGGDSGYSGSQKSMLRDRVTWDIPNVANHASPHPSTYTSTPPSSTPPPPLLSCPPSLAPLLQLLYTATHPPTSPHRVQSDYSSTLTATLVPAASPIGLQLYVDCDPNPDKLHPQPCQLAKTSTDLKISFKSSTLKRSFPSQKFSPFLPMNLSTSKSPGVHSSTHLENGTCARTIATNNMILCS